MKTDLLSETMLLWFTFIVGIGFWSAKILLEGIVGEIISQLHRRKFKKEACQYYKEVSDSFYEKAEAQKAESVAIARTVEKK